MPSRGGLVTRLLTATGPSRSAPTPQSPPYTPRYSSSASSPRTTYIASSRTPASSPTDGRAVFGSRPSSAYIVQADHQIKRVFISLRPLDHLLSPVHPVIPVYLPAQ